MKWRNITENNICCIRKVSAGSKPCNGVMFDVHLGEPIRPPDFLPAQCRLPRQKRAGTATAIHFMALQGELKAKAGERHPGSLLLKRLCSKEAGGELRKTGAQTAQMLELNLKPWCRALPNEGRPRQELGLLGMLDGSWAAAKGGGRIFGSLPRGMLLPPRHVLCAPDG